jgi:hypothetical protein
MMIVIIIIIICSDRTFKSRQNLRDHQIPQRRTCSQWYDPPLPFHTLPPIPQSQLSFSTCQLFEFQLIHFTLFGPVGRACVVKISSDTLKIYTPKEHRCVHTLSHASCITLPCHTPPPTSWLAPIDRDQNTARYHRCHCN